MGVDTFFRVWRRFNKKFGSAEEIAALREQYRLKNAAEDYSKNHENNEEEHRLDMPILLDCDFKADQPFSDDEPRSAFGNEDGKLYAFVGSFFFGRAFGDLRNYFELQTCKRSKCTSFVSREDVKKIVQAARYLLAGKHSDEMETLLENAFVEVLGRSYPKWHQRKSKNDQRIYIDKNGSDGWIVTVGDPESDREVEEENAEAEQSLKKLECCLAGALEIETKYDGTDDIVFEICAF